MQDRIAQKISYLRFWLVNIVTNTFKFRINLIWVSIFTLLLLSACSVAKLEARIEANPQCKDIINPKTGALMPCPGTDKAFYAAAGLGPTKTASTNAPVATNNSAPVTPNSSVTATSVPSSQSNSSSASQAAPQVECKPKLHQKSGSLMPCPAP